MEMQELAQYIGGGIIVFGSMAVLGAIGYGFYKTIKDSINREEHIFLEGPHYYEPKETVFRSSLERCDTLERVINLD